VTKVLQQALKSERFGLTSGQIIPCLAVLILTVTGNIFAASADPACPQNSSALYGRIRAITLDPERVYRIRDGSIDRPSLHLDFDDGTLAFTRDICGRVTGAFFEGEGEIRLRPPNRVERGALALFTGMAILEEQFSTGYLRFNDETATALQPFLAPLSNGPEFVERWDDTARQLAEFDALRLLLDFSHFLPATEEGSTREQPPAKFPSLLHAHLLGKKLGAFEIYWDALGSEPMWAGQPKVKNGALFFDLWTAFDPGNGGRVDGRPSSDLAITKFHIRASVHPPTTLRATTEVTVKVRTGGGRTLLFELSRYLKVDSVQGDGRSLDFVQNPALEGTQQQRRGDDLVAVVLPKALVSGQTLKLTFAYAGEVLSEAANGLLYVGERGTWYPNFGLSPAQFDMEFHYPADWTLIATGKPAQSSGSENEATNSPEASAPAEKTSRWISERDIPVAGFNLGKYFRAEAKAGKILVEAYGTRVVEKSFPKGRTEVIEPFPPIPSRRLRGQSAGPTVIVPPAPSPARDAQAVADRAAKAVENFSRWFGPYPYSSLSLTQMPGNFSQGWPGLVFLSSFAFLNPREQSDLRLDLLTGTLDNQVLVHETAHQWWGDLVLWRSYRDQWIAEGLSNYASLLMLEQQNPAQFLQVMEKYRDDLLSSNKDGERLRDAGPVTLGQRLQSSHFPEGYEEISYERGTWLFHMLRCMLRDSTLRGSKVYAGKGRDVDSPHHPHYAADGPSADEAFFRILRKVRDRYAGQTISSQQLLQAFEEDLPRPLWYERRPKLDWFMDGWINGTAIPFLESRDIRVTEKNGVTTVTGVIVQKGVPEDLVTAVPVYGSVQKGSLVFLGEVLADGAETPFRLNAPGEVHSVVLDPMKTILRSSK
jgi:hypothetical protein